jgi:hypothetical protein
MDDFTRRDAVKLAAAGAAALAVTNLVSSGNPLEGATASAQTINMLKGKTVRLGMAPGATPVGIQRALEEIFRLSGCRECGLLGYDIHLHGVNPDPAMKALDVISQFDGVNYADIHVPVSHSN